MATFNKEDAEAFLNLLDTLKTASQLDDSKCIETLEKMQKEAEQTLSAETHQFENASDTIELSQDWFLHLWIGDDVNADDPPSKTIPFYGTEDEALRQASHEANCIEKCRYTAIDDDNMTFQKSQFFTNLFGK